ncbi:MAG: HNH endonuclease [Phenylobacterium sp.]|uniref:HNH endonuclease n=1 Tax=Phenylobacterium sp. TaxID=1871053 RepID=UPI0027337038|nr:HNH endonuclease [Phenylobacterium sp.]MDP3747664.1 HNH endonuclease [Phenylobacterium sp.]
MAFSTQAGFINPNDQRVLGPTGLPGTDHGQQIYVLQCQRCAQVYGANGSDIAIRRCPSCDGGRPGFEITAASVIAAPRAAETKRSRNPNWTRDELILALDLYFDNPMADEHSAVVGELSVLLNRLWPATELDRKTLRNPAGVSMKLGNFQGLDPEYLASGRKGLPHGGRLEKQIWTEFEADRPHLKAVAGAIRRVLERAPEIAALADSSADAEAAEGAVLTRLHHYRERDRDLPNKRKAQALAQHGRLTCEACDFDFAAAYGERGVGFIEVHHTKPLETLQPGARTKLSELAVLCANCHRMVHAKRPWLTMEELKALVAARTAAPEPSSDFA